MQMSDNDFLQAISDIMDKKLEPIQSDIISLQSDMSTVKQKVDKIEKKITAIEMTLENETNKNIMAVAESHLDLSRKLDDAIYMSSKVDNKLIMQSMKQNTHDAEIKLIQEQLKIS